MNLIENITGFQHIGIPVADIEKSIEFYLELGFRISNRQQIKENGDITHIAFLDLNESCIELFQPAFEMDADRKNPGAIDHIALDVRNIDDAFREMKSRGYKPLEEVPVFLPLQAKGVRYFIILGPDGERVEFNQIL